MAFLCKMFRLLKELTKNDYRETQSTFQITIISCEVLMNIHSIHYYKAFLRNIWNFGLISTVIMGIIKCFPTYEVCTLLWSHTLWNNDHLHLTICVMLFFLSWNRLHRNHWFQVIEPGPTWKYFATLNYFTYFSFTCWFFCHLPEPQKFQTEDIIVSKTYWSRIWHFWTYILLIINFLAKLSRVATIYNQEYFAFPSYDSKLVEYRDRFFFLNCKNSLHTVRTVNDVLEDRYNFAK